MKNQNIIFFAVSGFLFFLFLVIFWQDYDREWKQYQRTFYKMQADLAETEKEKRDILRQSINIQQLILSANDADRCVTCHLGLEDPRFKDAPQPYTTHPGKNRHDFIKFGCTVCHQGQGLATTVEDAHGHVAFWEEPMLSKNELQASCTHCHKENYLEDGPVVSRGKELFISMGCHGCHSVKGYETLPRTGPSLKRIADKTNASWLVSWIKEPKKHQPNTQMPDFRFPEKEAGSIAAYLMSQSESEYRKPAKYDEGDADKGGNLIRSIGCLGCHSVGQEGDSFASDLSNVGNKVKPDWLVNWLLDPQAYDSHTVMPSFRISTQEAKDITSFLLNQKVKQIDASSEGEATPENIKQGKELIKKRGCTACHEINGIAHTRIGPNLNTVGSKLASHLDFGHTTKEEVERTWLSWVENRLKDPTIYDTETIKGNMPKFNLTDKDRKAIAVFLRGMDGRTGHSDMVRNISAEEFEVEQGKKAIAKYNCKGCHVIGGKGGNVFKLYQSKYYAPPPLEVNGLSAGERFRDSWVFPFLREPAPVRKWLNVKMPTFQLGEDEVYYIMRYFGDSGKGDVPAHLGAKKAAKPAEGRPVGGKELFIHYCSPCHGDKGLGDGFNSATLDPTPRDLSDQKEPYMVKQKNADLFKVVSLGGKAVDKSPRMPPYGNTLSEKEIWEIIAYVRTLHSYKEETIDLKGVKAERPQKAVNKISPDKFKGLKKRDILKGKGLYKKLGCSACHKIGDQGGIVGPELTHVSKRLNSTWIYQFLMSPQHMLSDVTMPNYGLSDKKVLTLAKYLHTLK